MLLSVLFAIYTIAFKASIKSQTENNKKNEQIIDNIIEIKYKPLNTSGFDLQC